MYDAVLSAAKLEAPILFRQKPDSVSVNVRTHPETGDEFVFVTNWSASSSTVDLGDYGILPLGAGEVCAGVVELRPFECLCGTSVPSTQAAAYSGT